MRSKNAAAVKNVPHQWQLMSAVSPPIFTTCVAYRSPRRPSQRPRKSLKSKITAEALERLIAERAGVPRSSVAVRGTSSRWEVTPIPRNGERATRIITAAYDLKDYELEA